MKYKAIDNTHAQRERERTKHNLYLNHPKNCNGACQVSRSRLWTRAATWALSKGSPRLSLGVTGAVRLRARGSDRRHHSGRHPHQCHPVLRGLWTRGQPATHRLQTDLWTVQGKVLAKAFWSVCLGEVVVVVPVVVQVVVFQYHLRFRHREMYWHFEVVTEAFRMWELVVVCQPRVSSTGTPANRWRTLPKPLTVGLSRRPKTDQWTDYGVSFLRFFSFFFLFFCSCKTCIKFEPAKRHVPSKLQVSSFATTNICSV